MKRIRKEYVRVARVSGKEGDWATFLVVDHQRFRITPSESVDKKTANWYAKNLAIALERMIAKESKP